MYEGIIEPSLLYGCEVWTLEVLERKRMEPVENGVLHKLKHIFPNTYQRIKSICSPARWDWLL